MVPRLSNPQVCLVRWRPKHDCFAALPQSIRLTLPSSRIRLAPSLPVSPVLGRRVGQMNGRWWLRETVDCEKEGWRDVAERQCSVYS